MADEEVHVKVAEIHLGDQVVASNELLNSMQPLHFEILITNATFGLVEIHTTSHLAGAFLRHGEECRPDSLEVSGRSSSTEPIFR